MRENKTIFSFALIRQMSVVGINEAIAHTQIKGVLV
jgi:hypothetical protein